MNILSPQILITQYSNHNLIAKYLNEQLDKAIKDYNISELDKFHYLIFKYKKIILEIK